MIGVYGHPQLDQQTVMARRGTLRARRGGDSKEVPLRASVAFTGLPVRSWMACERALSLCFLEPPLDVLLSLDVKES